MAKDKHEQLRNLALANFELLLDLWNVEYKRISDHEYDFKSPSREDTNFGACRFNVVKNIGIDFALPDFTEQDYQVLGLNFTKEDYAPVSLGRAERKQAFDVIGLCQRVYKFKSYVEATKQLRSDIVSLTTDKEYHNAKGLAEKRNKIIQDQRLYSLKQNDKTWNICKPIGETIGLNYLKNRCIEIGASENSIKFHHAVKNKEKNIFLPAIIFKVSKSPQEELSALHRIYLSPDGNTKANLNDPKMAMGPIKGSGIWFGNPGPVLHIAEGPENALSLRASKCEFVVSSVFSTNFHNLIIPEYVELVVLCPDPDPAGKAATIRAGQSYVAQQKKQLKLYELPGPDDWNDKLIKLRGQPHE